jgi:glycosyltransferase involved in cell wall biosynthesis
MVQPSVTDEITSTARTDLSVLVPTLNEENHVEEAVERIRAQRFDGGLEFLFIDGRSTDGTRQVLERLAADDSRIRVLDNPKRGIPFALNIGLRYASGEFVARMDAHALYPDDYLARGVERLKRGDADWVSGPQIATGTDRWSTRVALALSTPLGVGGAAFRKATREMEVDSGYTGIWRREMLIRHGGWDERWAVNEDGELAARVREAGGRIICVPEMAARYIPRDSLRRLASQYWRYGQYRAKTCGAHPESMRRSHLAPPVLAATALVAILPTRGGSRGARIGLAAYVAALLATAFSRVSAGFRDAATLPAVLATMHLAWGFGFLVGCIRFGPPLQGVAMLPRRGARRP